MAADDYPAPKCGMYIDSQTVSYPCSLPVGHLGPHYAVEAARSRSDRQRWETANPGLPGNVFMTGDPAPAPEPTPEPAPLAPLCLDPAKNTKGEVLLVCALPTGHGGSHAYQSPEIAQATPQAPQGAGEQVHTLSPEEIPGASFSHMTPADLPAHTQSVEGYAPPAEPEQPRPGDQPLPVINDSDAIQDLVIQDHLARKQIGIQRYGTPLQVFNGRDGLRDAYEEGLDLVVYLRGIMEERIIMGVMLERLYFLTIGERQEGPPEFFEAVDIFNLLRNYFAV